MLKCMFIGSNNQFDQVLVHWLSQRTVMCGAIWTTDPLWRYSLNGRWRFVKKRWQKYGFWKALNETLFYFYFHKFLKKAENDRFRKYILQEYYKTHGRHVWQGKEMRTNNVNQPEVLEFIEREKPDLIFAMCVNNYFGKKIRAIPPLGVYLWHEGYTPEYKGLYSPFWAVHNLDFDHIGYTLLKMNDEYDGGEVFVQGKAKDINPFEHHHLFMGHKAIFDSLPDVGQFLKNLEEGSAKSIDRSNSVSNYYTYPGITDYLRQRRRLSNHRKLSPKNQG